MPEGTIDGKPYPIGVNEQGQTLWQTVSVAQERDEIWDDWSEGVGETKRETGRGYLLSRGFDATAKGALRLSPFYQAHNNTALTTAYGYCMEAVETTGSTLTYDAASSGTGSAVSGEDAVTVAHTVTTNGDRLLLVGISANVLTSAGIASVKYAEESLTRLSYTQFASGQVSFWYLLEPATGANNIVVSLGGAATRNVVVGATSWYGVNQDAPFGTLVANNATSNSPAVTVTTAAGEFVADVIFVNGARTSTAGADQTERWDATATDISGNGSTQDGGDGGAMTETLSASAGWGALAVPIKPASTTSRSVMNISDTTKIFKYTYDPDAAPTLDDTDTTASGVAGRPAKMNGKWYCPFGSGANAVKLDNASTPTWGDAGWKADHLANYQSGIQPTLARVNSTTQNTVELNADTSGDVGDTWTAESQEVGDVSTKVTDLMETQGELIVAKEDSCYRFGSEGESFNIIPFLDRGKADADNGKGMDTFGDEVIYPSKGNLWRHRIGGGSLPIGVNTIEGWRKVSAIPTPKSGRHVFEVHVEGYRYTLLNDGEESHLLQRKPGSSVFNSVLTIPLSKGLGVDSRKRLWIKGASTDETTRDVRVIELAEDGSLDTEGRKGQASSEHDIWFDERNPGRPQDKVQLRHFTVELEGDWDATTSLQLKVWLDNATTAVDFGAAITSAGVTVRNPTTFGTSDTCHRFRPQLTLTTNSSYAPESSNPQFLRLVVGIRFPETIRIVIPADDALLEGITAIDVEQNLRRLQNQGIVAFGRPARDGDSDITTFNAEVTQVSDVMYENTQGNYCHGLELLVTRWITT